MEWKEQWNGRIKIKERVKGGNEKDRDKRRKLEGK